MKRQSPHACWWQPYGDKDRGDHNAEAVGSERQCEGGRYALLMAEMATALPSVAMVAASTGITAHPTRPRELRLLEPRARSCFGLRDGSYARAVSAFEKSWRQCLWAGLPGARSMRVACLAVFQLPQRELWPASLTCIHCHWTPQRNPQAQCQSSHCVHETEIETAARRGCASRLGLHWISARNDNKGYRGLAQFVRVTAKGIRAWHLFKDTVAATSGSAGHWARHFIASISSLFCGTLMIGWRSPSSLTTAVMEYDPSAFLYMSLQSLLDIASSQVLRSDRTQDDAKNLQSLQWVCPGGA